MGTITAVDIDLLERIGGSTAAVHRAIVRTTGRVVVVKRAAWGDTDAADGLAREAGVLGRVTHHHLVRLLALAEDDHGRLLVLEHAPGGSLAALLGGGPLAPSAAAELGAGVARAVAALHREGVVHRDVHPGNVLLDAELRPVLADLDNALDALGAPLPRDTEAVGHPDHVDLGAARPPTPADDLAGLASTVWTSIVGRPPGPLRPDQRLPTDPAVPARVQAALDRLRLGDTPAAAAATDLDVLALELAAGPTASSHPVPAGPRRTAHPPPTVAAAADSGTRRWSAVPGTPWAPTRDEAEPTGAGPHRRRRTVVALLAALALVAGPAAVLGAWARGGAGPQQDLAVTPPPPCDIHTEVAAAVLADLDGDDCSEPLLLRDGVLSAGGQRWSLGQPGDVLLAGDWDGDGRWSIALHRPATGAVHLFDRLPTDGPLTSSRTQQIPPGAVPLVTARPDGSHQVTARPRGGGISG